MAAVPCCADPVTYFPALLGRGNGNNFANSLMTRDDREGVSESCVLDSVIRMADTASEHFGEDLDVLVNGLMRSISRGGSLVLQVVDQVGVARTREACPSP